MDPKRQTFAYELFQDRARCPAWPVLFSDVGNTDGGFADLIAGHRRYRDGPARNPPVGTRGGAEAGLGDLTQARRSRVIALDALVPIVAPDNIR